jgi:hypothetical protein
MQSRESTKKCALCKNILESPVLLLCSHSICEKHVEEGEIFKEFVHYLTCDKIYQLANRGCLVPVNKALMMAAIMLNRPKIDSKILPQGSHKDLIDLCEFPIDAKWQLLYRSSEDGFSAKSFHTKCDNHANTLILVKSENGYVFGGYTQQFWNSTERGCFKADKNAFIFLLINEDKNPVKMKVINSEKAIWCNSSYGPCFGHDDFNIRGDEWKGSLLSGSLLGKRSVYQHPLYGHNTPEAYCFLAGSIYFFVSEMEVFSL